MSFRIGLLIGSAIGYIAGTKAGQERYRQMKKVAGTVSKVAGSDTVRRSLSRLIDPDHTPAPIVLEPVTDETSTAAASRWSATADRLRRITKRGSVK